MKKTRDLVRLRHWWIRRRGEGNSVSQICASAQIPTTHPRRTRTEAANSPHSPQNPPETIEKIKVTSPSGTDFTAKIGGRSFEA
jgi:hypothetical protein